MVLNKMTFTLHQCVEGVYSWVALMSPVGSADLFHVHRRPQAPGVFFTAQPKQKLRLNFLK